MSIVRLSGGLTPADGDDPRTFPAIWNPAADLIEANESGLSSVEGRVTVNEGDIVAVEARVGVNEGDISGIDSRVGVNEGDINSIDGRVGVNEGDISSIDGRVTINEGDISSIDGRVTVNEADIVDLKDGDYQKYYLAGPLDNRWFGPTFGTTSVNNIPLPIDILYVGGAQVSKNIKIDRVGIIVETGEAGATARLGLYENDNGYPGALIVDAGTIDASTAGAKNIVVDVDLDAGLVWCGVVLQDVSSTLRVRSSALDSGTVMNYTTSQLAVSQGHVFAVSDVDGVLPSTVDLANPNIRRMINFQFRVSEVL